MSENALELVEMLLEWGIVKLSAREGFSVLMLEERGDDRTMAKYSLDTVEEAILRAVADIRQAASEIGAYALCYDVTIRSSVGPLRGFLLHAEERDSLCRYVLFHPVSFRGREAVLAPGGLHPVEEREKLLTAGGDARLG